MSPVVLDDHLLRDVLADDVPPSLRRIMRRRSIATTNLYYLRLCKSVVAARGGRLTGTWGATQRRALGKALIELPDDITIVPLQEIAFRMAELSAAHPLSALGAEAVAAAERLGAPLCVWQGDDGPHLRTAAGAAGVEHLVVDR